MEVKVYTEVGVLTAILVKDAKQSGYTVFFKEKEWDNLITQGETIEDSITHLFELLNTVTEYKKNRKSAVDFGQWILKNAKPSFAVKGEWYINDNGYAKDTEELYDLFIKNISNIKFQLHEENI